MEGCIKRRNMTKEDIIRSALTSLRITDIEEGYPTAISRICSIEFPQSFCFNAYDNGHNWDYGNARYYESDGFRLYTETRGDIIYSENNGPAYRFGSNLFEMHLDGENIKFLIIKDGKTLSELYFKASLFPEYDEPDEDYYDINFDPEDVLDPLQV